MIISKISSQNAPHAICVTLGRSLNWAKTQIFSSTKWRWPQLTQRTAIKVNNEWEIALKTIEYFKNVSNKKKNRNNILKRIIKMLSKFTPYTANNWIHLQLQIQLYLSEFHILIGIIKIKYHTVAPGSFLNTE